MECWSVEDNLNVIEIVFFITPLLQYSITPITRKRGKYEI